jgi:tetratricopeptide (TPR) repeat protein
VAANTQNGEQKTNESGARPAAEMTGAANDGRRKTMLGNRKVTEVAPLLAALLAILFSVGTARAQSSDRRSLANSDRQSDFAVFSPAAHASSPPSDLLKGNVAENASAVSVRELTIPDKAQEAYNKGIRQADADDWAGSVPNFQRAIKSFPAYYEAYSGLGVAEVYLQSWNDAEASFRKCIELSGGTFAAAHFGLGLILSHRKQFPEAEAMIREGIQLDPADARGHFSLAWVLHTMGRLPEAEQSAREAILHKPTFPDPYLLLAQIHLDQGNFSSEIEDLDGYLKVDPLGPLSARARAALADAERSLAKENAAVHQNP